MKTVTNLYILNLAFADEFFLLCVPILIYTMHLGEWIFGVYLCKLYMISTSITQFTSSIFLVIMSADRFASHFHFSIIPENNQNSSPELQIYCRMSSNQFAPLSNTVGIKSGFDHCLVCLGRAHATDNSLLDHHTERRR